MRGGTSKALVFHRDDLPDDQDRWAPIFRAAMGSPDPFGRQLDGMGGGVSSLSKVCVVGPSHHADVDVDYTFAQLSIKSDLVDYSGNCGNMSAAVGPFAVYRGIVAAPREGEVTVRILNTNTGKVIHSHFQIRAGLPRVSGNYVVDGVTGGGAPIRLEFQEPYGTRSGRLLPTGLACELLEYGAGKSMPVSLIDGPNPLALIAADALELSGVELPAELAENQNFVEQIEAIGCAAAMRMGLAQSIEGARMTVMPQIAIVSPMNKEAATISGERVRPQDADLLVRLYSSGQPHQAVPITGSMGIAISARVPGTVSQQALSPDAADHTIRLAHPSGVSRVSARVTKGNDGYQAKHASVTRTARLLFNGEVFFQEKGK